MKHNRNSAESTYRRTSLARAPAHQGRPECGMEAVPSRLPDAERHEVVRLLNTLLADEFALFTKTLNFHWNVEGMQFHSLHSFLEGHYRELLTIADDLAERVRTVSGVPLGSMADFLKAARLDEHTGEPPDPEAMISRLLLDHARILDHLREDIDAFEEKYDDAGTCNFLMNLLERQEKLAWILRAHLARISH